MIPGQSKDIQCCERHLTLLPISEPPNQIHGTRVNLVITDDHFDCPARICVHIYG